MTPEGKSDSWVRPWSRGASIDALNCKEDLEICNNY
uniref:Uncharacterized protein n=1 Tax=Rhizophora mucronata TaxID=61149 RepID=A0A2P2P1G7_RHIMU